MKSLPTVMLVGVGSLGGPILDALARSRRVGRVVAVSRDAGQGAARCNLAALTAAAVGVATPVEHRSVDLALPDQLAEALVGVAPDIIVHAASMQTWWLPDLFPQSERSALRRVGFGAWVPLHLALSLRFAKAVSAAGFCGIVLNASYPDVINVVLSRVGLPVTAGVGNVDELVAKLRMRLVSKLGATPEELDIRLVAHHALQGCAFAGSRAAADPDAAPSPAPAVTGGHLAYPASGAEADAPPTETPPFHLHVERDGRDITAESGAARELLDPCPLPPGPGWGTFTAASTLGLVEALLAESPTRLHVPGPEGLPGGYPVDIAGGALTISEIPGLTRDQAIAINERSHRFDGIDRIEDDGSVVFTEETTAVMSDTLGYDCEVLAPDEAAGRATELAERFEAFAARHRVDLAAAARMS